MYICIDNNLKYLFYYIYNICKIYIYNTLYFILYNNIMTYHHSDII